MKSSIILLLISSIFTVQIKAKPLLSLDPISGGENDAPKHQLFIRSPGDKKPEAADFENMAGAALGESRRSRKKGTEVDLNADHGVAGPPPGDPSENGSDMENMVTNALKEGDSKSKSKGGSMGKKGKRRSRKKKKGGDDKGSGDDKKGAEEEDEKEADHGGAGAPPPSEAKSSSMIDDALKEKK